MNKEDLKEIEQLAFSLPEGNKLEKLLTFWYEAKYRGNPIAFCQAEDAIDALYRKYKNGERKE